MHLQVLPVSILIVVTFELFEKQATSDSLNYINTTGRIISAPANVKLNCQYCYFLVAEAYLVLVQSYPRFIVANDFYSVLCNNVEQYG